MARLPPSIAIRLEGKDSYSVARTVIEELCEENSHLRAEKDKLEAENRRLLAELARLRQPKKTPQNSSVPPSQGMKLNGRLRCDGVVESAKRRRGHPGAHRPLGENPTQVMDMLAATCPHCSADVSGVEQGEAEAYDHVEIPLAPAVITRVILRHGTCPCCSKGFKAAAPQGMESGSPFGPNLRAAVLHLRHGHAVSYERLAVLLELQFGVKVSEGALASMLKAAGPAFAAQAETIRQRLLAGTVIGSDETRFRVGKANWWLWVFQNPDSCFFRMAPGCGKDVVEQFLGGVVPPAWVSDRLGSQAGWAALHRV
jgi:transposase